jgi:UDP-N-acetylglucosamine 2-epimerase (non-hydrolysing)
LLVTLHRRESFGRPLAAALSAVRRLIDEHADLVAVYPVHPNPNVAGVAHALLERVDRLYLVPPLDYPQFVAAMQQADLIITDSGGIQEEAVTLNKRVLVARNRTERPEGVEAGLSSLVGTDPDHIFAEAKRLLDNATEPAAVLHPSGLYGDGQAGERIADIIEVSFNCSRKRAVLAGE